MARSEWEAAEAAHQARVDVATAAHLRRREDGRRHPVEDFLFTYYSQRPAQLRRWHPGPGVVLAGAAGLPRAGWRFYTRGRPRSAARPDRLRRVPWRDSAVRRRPARGHPREAGPVRLLRPARVGDGLPAGARTRSGTPAGRCGWAPRAPTRSWRRTSSRCSHFDAFRFFTPPARPLNLLQPTRERQVAIEQPGCLHAGMDLYKWAYKLTPAVPSDLVMDCFDLARDIRELDMRASPYDLTRARLHAGADRDAAGEGGVCRRAARLRSARPGPARPAAGRGYAGLRPRAGGQRSRDAGPDQAVGDPLDQGLPGRLDDVGGHADGLPRRLCRRRSR